MKNLILSLFLFLASSLAMASTSVLVCSTPQADGSPEGNCPSTVWINIPDPVDLNAMSAAGQTFVEQLMSIPASADLSQAWFLGFSLPVTLYLVSFGVGAVVNFINRKD